MDKVKFDCVIIGAGPAGIFTALKLNKLNKDANILIVDMGRKLSSRTCPARKTGVCVHCKPCGIVSGWSGAGAFSDGKLSLSREVGGHLAEYVGDDKADELIKEADDIYLSFGADKEIHGLYNVLDDIYVNNLVFQRNKFFDSGCITFFASLFV